MTSTERWLEAEADLDRLLAAVREPEDASVDAHSTAPSTLDDECSPIVATEGAPGRSVAATEGTPEPPYPLRYDISTPREMPEEQPQVLDMDHACAGGTGREWSGSCESSSLDDAQKLLAGAPLSYRRGPEEECNIIDAAAGAPEGTPEPPHPLRYDISTPREMPEEQPHVPEMDHACAGGTGCEWSGSCESLTLDAQNLLAGAPLSYRIGGMYITLHRGPSGVAPTGVGDFRGIPRETWELIYKRFLGSHAQRAQNSGDAGDLAQLVSGLECAHRALDVLERAYVELGSGPARVTFTTTELLAVMETVHQLPVSGPGYAYLKDWNTRGLGRYDAFLERFPGIFIIKRKAGSKRFAVEMAVDRAQLGDIMRNAVIL